MTPAPRPAPLGCGDSLIQLLDDLPLDPLGVLARIEVALQVVGGFGHQTHDPPHQPGLLLPGGLADEAVGELLSLLLLRVRIGGLGDRRAHR